MVRTWWKEGVVYQIYPRSFRDSDGDGVGDLRGIIEKLDYIASLGANIVWLNPIYASPNYDNGYDISDYERIMDEFGTMADFDELLRGFHSRGIRLVMDLVVNHSSSAHPWFLESRRSVDSPKRGYYIWRKGVDGGPPNNWRACFTGPAWEYDEASGEYYLHLFAPQQPDLNWENPALRSEIYSMMRRWFARGVDGFRMDVINVISKDPSYRDLAEGETMFSTTAPYVYGPRLHEFIREMRREAIGDRDVMTVGETPGSTVEKAIELVGEGRGELDMLFQFELMDVDCEGDKWHRRPLDLVAMKRIIERWQTGLHGVAWNSNFLMNHDQPRSVSRFGNDGAYRSASAKALLALNLSLGGTPYVYQGEELGMTNSKWEGVGDFRDLDSINYYREAVAAGADEGEVMDSLRYMSRDNSRTPMQWGPGPNAGFTSGEPWIGVNPNYRDINAAAEEGDPQSVLHFARRMIRFRKEHLALVYGRFELVAPEDPALFAFTMDDGAERLLFAANMSEEPRGIPRAEEAGGRSSRSLEPLLSSLGDGRPAGTHLAPWEARIWRLV